MQENFLKLFYSFSFWGKCILKLAILNRWKRDINRTCDEKQFENLGFMQIKHLTYNEAPKTYKA